MMSDILYHRPVLRDACVCGLDVQRTGSYIDATFGGGGHTRAILEKLGSEGRLIGFDRDPDAVLNAPADPRFTFVAANFRYLINFTDYYGLTGRVDGILVDLGVSSHQFDTAERGFSFRADSPTADMRMNNRAGQTAADILAAYDEQQLRNLFFRYGELPMSGRIAKAVVAARTQGRCPQTVGELSNLLRPLLSPRDEKSQLARAFQALRIEVNDEMGALSDLLTACRQALRPRGRLAVITYHSIEDRIVKQFFRESIADDNGRMLIYGHDTPEWNSLSRKPITPTEEEVADNPRARSARLRIAEKLS